MAPRGLIALLMGIVLCGTSAAQESLPDRLAALEPAEPAQYKQLAEELAAKSTDAEARAAAIRLFHIVVWLDPENLGAGSLRSMIAIARSPEEEKRLRAAAYLFDPTAEPSSLRTVTSSAETGASATPPPAELLRAVRQLRQGSREAARQSLAAQSVRDYLAGEVNRSLREDLQALLAATTLNERQLRRVLELELRWSQLPAGSSGGTGPISTQPWSKLTREAITAPNTSATLLDLTEFDPRENVYRGGKFTVDSSQ